MDHDTTLDDSTIQRINNAWSFCDHAKRRETLNFYAELCKSGAFRIPWLQFLLYVLQVRPSSRP